MALLQLKARLADSSDVQLITKVITAFFGELVSDPDVLEIAVREVLINTVQHGPGRAYIMLEPDKLTVRNLVMVTDCPKAGLGLKMFACGILGRRIGKYYVAEVDPSSLAVKCLALAELGL